MLVNGTTAANNVATDDVGHALGQYLMSAPEVEDMSAGAAGMLRRRVPTGLGNPDLADLLRIGAALVSYVGRQFRIMRAANAARRQKASATPAQNEEDNGS